MTTTREFLAVITPKAKNLILDAIGGHYGISREAAYAEVTDPEAENLLDYLQGSERAAAGVLMQRYRFDLSQKPAER